MTVASKNVRQTKITKMHSMILRRPLDICAFTSLWYHFWEQSPVLFYGLKEREYSDHLSSTRWPARWKCISPDPLIEMISLIDWPAITIAAVIRLVWYSPSTWQRGTLNSRNDAHGWRFNVVCCGQIVTDYTNVHNTLRPRQYGQYFADDIFKRIYYLMEMFEFR